MILSVWVVKVIASSPEKAEEGRVRQGFGSVGSFSAKNAIFQFEDVFFERMKSRHNLPKQSQAKYVKIPKNISFFTSLSIKILKQKTKG